MPVPSKTGHVDKDSVFVYNRRNCSDKRRSSVLAACKSASRLGILASSSSSSLGRPFARPHQRRRQPMPFSWRASSSVAWCRALAGTEAAASCLGSLFDDARRRPSDLRSTWGRCYSDVESLLRGACAICRRWIGCACCTANERPISSTFNTTGHRSAAVATADV